MKFFIPVLFLILCLQSLTKAEDKINSLFGVKLNDDISNYAEVENGKLTPGFSEQIFTFTDKFLKIDRDESFFAYGIRTDKNYKVKVLNAAKIFRFENDFTDTKCIEEKEKYISILSSELGLDKSKFKNFYRKSIHKETLERSGNVLWNDSNYVYIDNDEKFRLSVFCSYQKKNRQR